MQTPIKRSLAAVAMLVTGLLIGLLSRNALSQNSSTMSAGSDVGRYQLFTCGQSMNPYIYFIDTKTGRVWMKGQPGEATWTEEKVPLPGK